MLSYGKVDYAQFEKMPPIVLVDIVKCKPLVLVGSKRSLSHN